MMQDSYPESFAEAFGGTQKRGFGEDRGKHQYAPIANIVRRIGLCAGNEPLNVVPSGGNRKVKRQIVPKSNVILE